MYRYFLGSILLWLSAPIDEQEAATAAPQMALLSARAPQFLGFSIDHPEQISIRKDDWSRLDFSQCKPSERTPAKKFPSQGPENYFSALSAGNKGQWVNGHGAACVVRGALLQMPGATAVRVPILPGSIEVIGTGRWQGAWPSKGVPEGYSEGFCALWNGLSKSSISLPDQHKALDAYLTGLVDPILAVIGQRSLILDWHYIADHEAWGKETNLSWPAFESCTQAFWTVAADAYGNDPQVVFELFNEPVLKEEGEPLPATELARWQSGIRDLVVSINQKITPGVAKTFLIGAPRWSQPRNGEQFEIQGLAQAFPQHTFLQVSHLYVDGFWNEPPGTHESRLKGLQLPPTRNGRLPIVGTELGFPQRVSYNAGMTRLGPQADGWDNRWKYRGKTIQDAAYAATTMFDWHEGRGEGWIAWMYGYHDPNLLDPEGIDLVAGKPLSLSDYGAWVAARLQ